jgi:flagellar hook-basal body complex protein FliE
MNPVNKISTPLTLPGFAPDRPRAAEGTSSFKEFLLGSIREVNSMQQAADQAVEKLATGEEVNPAQVLTAVQKADIAFRMMMQIRNKIVQAYQEVQNIRV